MLAPELVSGQELLPALLGHQLLDLLPAHVDAVVEVATPKHIVVRENMATLLSELDNSLP